MMLLMKKIYQKIIKSINENPILKLKYLKLATFLATRGIRPPLTGRPDTFLQNWSTQGQNGSPYNPVTYKDEDNSVALLFQDILPYLDPEDSLLEIGCNCGRSLNYLNRKGFNKLYGIEIGQEAINLMKNIFPDTYRTSSLQVGNAPEILKQHEAQKYKMVFCHSVLVNIPTTFNYVFKEMARVSNKYIVTLENEASWTAYPRDFKKLFEDNGFIQIGYKYFTPNDKNPPGLTLPHAWNDKTVFTNNVLRIFVRK